MGLSNNFLRFWRDLENGEKMTLSVAAITVIAGAVLLLWWAQRPQMRLLYSGLPEKDAAAIVEHLESNGVDYEIRAGGHALYVRSSEVYSARMSIASEGLISGGQVGYELFDDSSFGVSDFVQRTNYVRAIQGELSRTIVQLDGVRHARVMVVIPDNRMLLRDSQAQTTASVFVDVGGSPLSPSAVRAIQALVSSSVEGLEFGNVAVVDNNGKVLSQDEDENHPLAASARAMEYRRSVEDYFSSKVQSMLEKVLGTGRVVVRVSADINTGESSSTHEAYDPDGTVVRSLTTEEKTEEEFDAAPAPTVSMEAGQGNAGSGNQPGTSKFETITKQQEYDVSRTVTNTVQHAGTVNRLTVSVLVEPRQEPRADGSMVSRPRSSQEIDRLRQVVADALGIRLNDPASGSVSVEEMEFAPTHLELPSGWGTGFDVTTILNFGREISGTILAAVLFFIFLRLLKRMRNETSPWAEFHAADQMSGLNGSAPAKTITPELLNEMIQQKPENAGAMLRNWLEDRSQRSHGH